MTSRLLVPLARLAAFALLLALLAAAPASAAAPTLTASSPATGYTGASVTVSGAATPPGGELVLERRVADGPWRPVSTGRPADDGSYALRLVVAAGAQTLRVSYRSAGGTVARELRVTGVAAPVRVSLSGSHRLRDGHRLVLTARWTTTDGRPVSGVAQLYGRRAGSSTWTRRASVRVTNGTGTVRVRPRVDTTYQLRTPATTLVRPAGSSGHVVDNLPPGRVIRTPAGAPAPRRTLPPQRRAIAAGPHVRVKKISARVWRSMKGRSWHRGCPVGRSSLRLIETSYYAYDGYRRRGELVVHRSVAKATKRVLIDLYEAKAPIRSMYRVDPFGWSKRLRGADDMKSMAAGNTSAFNCRGIVGRPGTRSPHSTGRSIDLNTWENPYRSGWGLVPNSAWDARRTPTAIVYRSRQHAVVRILARHGFRWMGSADWQHFQYVGRGARHLPPPTTFLD
ncbi:M15 family metallopeptidase [Mumia sp. ZJ1417]|uniref:M15 family metallopeptidase n=1 Tax=Mumia sp. ZJ1417 TaxID=2708082 RepID=UPI001421E985|nr:M15 family metallopeptidase [Mumia sp. ZJ1417]QMW67889.1 M15 family metallopeptidase [Mumia sp. ZJ1417]